MSFEIPDESENKPEQNSERAEYGGLLRFGLERKAVLAGLLGVAGAIGGRFLGTKEKPFLDRLTVSWQAVGKVEEYLDESHFQKVSDSYEGEINNIADEGEREKLKREFETTKRMRGSLLRQEQKDKEVSATLAGMLKFIF